VRSTYSVSEAQAELPALPKKVQSDLIAIAKRDKIIAYLVSAKRMEAIAATLGIMADRKAMRAIGGARRGRGKYYPVTILDERGSR
jgi:PHD/YefM family antitoxin component YafN of YafNO toxin-antitoxin module